MIRILQLKVQIATLCLVVGSVCVFISPYVAQRSLENAVAQGDQRTVSSMIDVSAAQDNTAAWMTSQLGEITPALGSGGPIGNFVSLGGVAQLLGGAYFHAQMKQYLTEPMIADAVTETIRDSRSHADRGGAPFGARYLPKLPDQYRDFSHFEFWSTSDALPIHVVLCRQYFVSWHVCGFEGKDVISQIGDALQHLMSPAGQREFSAALRAPLRQSTR